MQLPPDASSTLYVEGLPADATEREVGHIFRRFEGQARFSLMPCIFITLTKMRSLALNVTMDRNRECPRPLKARQQDFWPF